LGARSCRPSPDRHAEATSADRGCRAVMHGDSGRVAAQGFAAGGARISEVEDSIAYPTPKVAGLRRRKFRSAALAADNTFAIEVGL
jgi:hypothetical protein